MYSFTTLEQALWLFTKFCAVVLGTFFVFCLAISSINWYLKRKYARQLSVDAESTGLTCSREE